MRNRKTSRAEKIRALQFFQKRGTVEGILNNQPSITEVWINNEGLYSCDKEGRQIKLTVPEYEAYCNSEGRHASRIVVEIVPPNEDNYN